MQADNLNRQQQADLLVEILLLIDQARLAIGRLGEDVTRPYVREAENAEHRSEHPRLWPVVRKPNASGGVELVWHQVWLTACGKSGDGTVRKKTTQMYHRKTRDGRQISLVRRPKYIRINPRTHSINGKIFEREPALWAQLMGPEIEKRLAVLRKESLALGQAHRQLSQAILRHKELTDLGD